MSAQASAGSNQLRNAACCYGRCFLSWILTAPLVGSGISHASVTDQFIRLTTYPSGGTPIAIASADFNHDGKNDIAALNSNGVLSILLGTGTGAFAAPKTITTYSSVPASFLFAADFNGDSNQDLLLLESGGNAIDVYPGRGDGSFATPIHVNVGLSAAGNLAIGDFNGDLRPDVAVVNSTAISVLLGKAGGYFQAPIVTATGLSALNAMALALGDVNRDGRLDAVVTDQNDSFQVLLGSGHGTFRAQAISSFVLPVAPNSLAIADFNLDGKPDIAAGVGGPLPQFFNGEVCLIPGNGDGTFDQSSPPCFGAPDSFQQIQVTDLNGRPGLLLPSNPVRVLLTSASAAVSETAYAAGGGPVAVGDFNGDGRQDVVSGNRTGVEVLLNAANGVLHAPIDVGPLNGSNSFAAMTAINTTDFNSDGFADLAIVENAFGHGGSSPDIGALLGAPANRMNAGAPVFLDLINANANPPAIGDFNHDGHLDIAYSSTFNDSEGNPAGRVQVLFGDGKGNFPIQGPALPLISSYLAAGYFNGGGVEDLASVTAGNLEILIGKGDGTFAPPVPYAVGTTPVFILQRDLNNDGKRDLVVVNQDSDNISVLLGNGDGSFKPQKTYVTGNAPVTAVTGDFNRDGKVDIAVGSTTGVSILLGNGDGTFQPQKIYTATGPVTGIVQTSVRQDGIECLLTVDSASQRFVLLPGGGDGTFKAPVFFPLDRIPTAIVAGDFNRDGATDIVLLGNGRLAIFYNQGGNYVSLSSNPAAPKANEAVTFTAHVTPGWGEIARVSGNVTFKDGTTVLGTVSLQERMATMTRQLTAGTHHIVALYGGNSTLNPNHSPTLIVETQ